MGQQDNSAREGIRLSSLMTRANPQHSQGWRELTPAHCPLTSTHIPRHTCVHTQRQISKRGLKKIIRAYRNLKGWLEIYTQSIWERMGRVSLRTREQQQISNPIARQACKCSTAQTIFPRWHHCHFGGTAGLPRTSRTHWAPHSGTSQPSGFKPANCSGRSYHPTSSPLISSDARGDLEAAARSLLHSANCSQNTHSLVFHFWNSFCSILSGSWGLRWWISSSGEGKIDANYFVNYGDVLVPAR